MTDKKTIGVLTSGGDCAGLNAVIRAVTHRAVEGYGWRVLGIHQGTQGLMRRPVDHEELTLEIFTGNILRMGGTILGTTNRGDPFAFPMPSQRRGPEQLGRRARPGPPLKLPHGLRHEHV